MVRLATERDVYANLLRDSRGLRREQSASRDGWFAALPWEAKEDTLFELEMLLKGIACYGNQRNHPGKPQAKTAVAQDFHEHMRVVRDASHRVVALTKSLLGDRERAYTFQRYLETVVPEDAARGKLVQEQLTQDTPEDALFVMRNSFGAFLDVSEGLLRLGRIGNRLYYAHHGILVREIGRNTYFNPLMALEFRMELDRIRSAEVLDVLATVRTESAHRVLALAFLTLFRALRYTELVDRYASDPLGMRRAYVILAVLRSDVRALVKYLGQRAADSIADGFERELLLVPAREIAARHRELATEARSLGSLRSAMEAIASSLRLEIRRVYEHDLPSPESAEPEKDLGPQMVIAMAQIRASLHAAIQALCQEVRPGAPLPELSADLAARRAGSDRLRREIWMFQQILRAFLAMAAVTSGSPDVWLGHTGYQFVRDFLLHFRSIGYQLVRAHDYERLDPFLRALEELRDVDLLDPARMDLAVAECRAFSKFLGNLFEKVSARAELREVAFDKGAASDMLKVYLGKA
jgi:hypothetical protein